jgi:hypothetical protein
MNLSCRRVMMMGRYHSDATLTVKQLLNTVASIASACAHLHRLGTHAFVYFFNLCAKFSVCRHLSW